MNSTPAQTRDPFGVPISLARDVIVLGLAACLVSLLLGGLAFAVDTGSPEAMRWPLLGVAIVCLYVPALYIGGGLRGSVLAVMRRFLLAVVVSLALAGLGYGGYMFWQAVMDERNGAIVPGVLLVAMLSVILVAFGRLVGGPVRPAVQLPVLVKKYWRHVLAVVAAVASVALLWEFADWPVGAPMWERYVWSFLCIILPFAVLDYFWIHGVMERLYRKNLRDAVREKMQLVGVLAWVPVCGALAVVAIPRAVSDESWQVAAQWGAFIGLMLSAFYAFTLVTWLEGYSRVLLVLEVAWGAFLGLGVTWMAQRVALL
jgi:uncharacterized membrane protein